MGGEEGNMGINVHSSMKQGNKSDSDGQEYKTNFAYYNFHCVKFVLSRFLSFHFDYTHIDEHTHARTYTSMYRRVQTTCTHTNDMLDIRSAFNGVNNVQVAYLLWVSVFCILFKSQCDFLFLAIPDSFGVEWRRGQTKRENWYAHGQTMWYRTFIVLSF